MTTLPAGATAKNVSFVSRCDQGGRLDGVQVIVHKGYAYVGHMFSDGFSVIDVRDPKNPRTVAFVAAPKNTRSHHLQISGDILLTINGPNVWAMSQYSNQADYFMKPLAESFKSSDPFAAGMRVFDISNPAAPREIGFLSIPGFGAHRIWWVGGRYAYLTVHFEGFIDHALAVIDVADPMKPKLVGRAWLPGMNAAAGEKPTWKGKRYALHHVITAGNYAYGAWRDGGFTVHDVSDPPNPKLVSHRVLSPPFAGGSHTPLPLPGRYAVVLADEATSSGCANGLAYSWVIDVRAPDNPITIATLPTPAEEDFCKKGDKFGPHNFHENRPGSMVSEETVFGTYHNAGLRVFDVRNLFEPKEIGYFVPPKPEKIVDIRPNPAKQIQSCDVFVDANGLMFMTDTNAGLYIMQWDGAK
jgi:hypothetical protein